MIKSCRKKEAVNIAEVTKLYATYVAQLKAIEVQAKEYKQKILMYAEENQENFKGKTLELPNNIRVEKRETMKASYKEDGIDLEWLESALENDMGNAISIKIDPKDMAKKPMSKPLQNLLNAIDFAVEVKEFFAVCVTT